MTAVDTDIASRLALLEGRVARVEAKVAGGSEDDDACDSATAARLLNRSYSGLRRLIRHDTKLLGCFFKPQGEKSHLVWSRKALEQYKAARS